jgi:hypothetical protein
MAPHVAKQQQPLCSSGEITKDAAWRTRCSPNESHNGTPARPGPQNVILDVLAHRPAARPNEGAPKLNARLNVRPSVRLNVRLNVRLTRAPKRAPILRLSCA